LTAYALPLELGSRFRLAVHRLEVWPGDLVGVVGPNGSGKSTLLRALAGIARPACGQVVVAGQDVGSLPHREVARRVGYLPQERTAWEDLTVAGLVERGLYPLAGLTAEARGEMIQAALSMCGLADLAGSRLSRLSGGERQRAWLAFVLARQPAVLLLDEPTAHLDCRHQAEVMALVASLCRQGKAAVVVLHDLWLAARYCHRLLVLSSGHPVVGGPPREALRPELLREVFGVEPPVPLADQRADALAPATRASEGPADGGKGYDHGTGGAPDEAPWVE
jgi:iron complex transport system ATP-binding protein